MRFRDQRTFVDRVNNPASAKERFEIDGADRGRTRAVMKRRIRVRAT